MGIPTRATGPRGNGMGSAWRIKESGYTAGSGVTVSRVGTGSGKATTHLLDTTVPGATGCRMDMGSKPMAMAVRKLVFQTCFFNVCVSLTSVTDNVLCSLCVRMLR